MIVYRTPVEHSFTSSKVVLLSGLSDPATCALSPVQRDFLAALHAPDARKIYWNFPYAPCLPGERPPPLWRASWHNLRQFVLAARPRYREAARRHWDALAASADEVCVITLSCGLEILNQCITARSRVRVLALGPVAWKPPPVPHTLVQGERDLISRWFFRTADVILPGSGHMDYLRHPRMLELANAFLCGSTSP